MKFIKLIIYVVTGFYLGYLISALLDITDICGSEQSVSYWGPKGFLTVATLLLVIYYFISYFIKKDLYFIFTVIIIAIIFEGLVAQPYIKGNEMNFFELWMAMPIVHIIIFYIPRLFLKKVKL